MSVTLTLGNAVPLNQDGSLAEIANGCDHNQTETVYEFPFTPDECAAQVDDMEQSPEHRLAIRGLGENRNLYVYLEQTRHAWGAHHGGDGPDWVESDNAQLASLVAEHYGCPVGRPDGWGS